MRVTRKSFFAALLGAVGLKAQSKPMIDGPEYRCRLLYWDKEGRLLRTGAWTTGDCAASVLATEVFLLTAASKQEPLVRVSTEVRPAQQSRPEEPTIAPHAYIESRIFPKKNGECPLCGTQAPPFNPKPRPMCADEAVFVENKILSGCGEQFLPKLNLEDCSNCHAAFWQKRSKDL